MSVYAAVLKRRTIRRFLQKPLSRDFLKRLVNAGRLAPSGANLQPLEFIVVEDKVLLGKVFATLKWAAYIAPAGDPPQGKRPVAYIVVLINKEIKKEKGEVDAAAAIENMILVATDEGVGCCWLGDSIKYWKDEQGVLHVPKRKIDQVIHFNGYSQ
ncbi:hypothetical protein B6D60_03065 [candidate division KSB1 bacterium 4484_87]|nr:MAG: hypothetical protein B6D60_03065 [candidate division KSB1 bacterium 4484_87]